MSVIRGVARVVATVLDYAGVLAIFLVGLGCVATGVVREEISLLVIGAVVALLAAVWALVFRAEGGSPVH